MFPTLDTIQLWLVSNGVGALAFIGLTLYLLPALRSRGAAFRLLCLASALTGLWFVILLGAVVVRLPGALVDGAESLRTAAWVLTAAWLLPIRGDHVRVTRTYRRLALAAAAIFVALGLARPLAAMALGLAPGGHSGVFVLAALAIALFGLTLIEHVYRVSDLDARWALKFLCTGMATLLAYDFVMYSGALVSHRIPLAVWNARGFVDALTVPLIAVSAGRHARWRSRISVSHRALFSAGALVAAGLYLLVAAAGTAFIRRFGGNWGEVAALLFGVVALIGLAVLVGSGRVRATTRVLIRKHLLSYRYDYREQWLGLTRRLGHADDDIDVYERAVRAIAHAIDSPAGALWIVRDDQFVCISDWNMPRAQDVTLSVTLDFIRELARTGWVIDRDQSESQHGAPALPDAIGALPRARLLLPLFAGADRLVGFMVLDSPRSGFALGWEEIDLLKVFGQQVGVYLDYQESSRALTQARQFETFNRLTAFLMHDLKNIAGQQSLIVQNARRHRHNPEFIDDMIETVEHSVARMQSVLDQLRNVSTQAGRTERIGIDDTVAEVLASLRQTRPVPYCVTPPTKALVEVDEERLGMVLRHLVRNAQDASRPEGVVSISLETTAEHVVITVADDGVGMSAAFIRDSLFQPFVSTKAARGMGIGAFQVRDFARGAGGDVRVTSTPGQGTRFVLRLPRVGDETHGPHGLSKGGDVSA